ncbi:MAG: DUF1003 domain-containing protein [Chloroflexota bacterium]
MSHLRFHEPHAHLASAFGDGGFGKRAEAFARFFGTPKFIIIQTGIVVAWIVLNATGVFSYDLYPFILLNLGFSLQAAYAAPLILLAQTRQADRDKMNVEADARHREELSTLQLTLLKENTKLTEQIAALSERIEGLTKDLHAKLIAD